MYKLLVVDDEFNIRDGIANAIAWNKINVEVVGMAIDGIDALDKVALLSPDIIITDVTMDKMDGLELTDILKQRYPFIRVIILSGYDEFEYVRKALELRVYSYVMKPIRSKELIEIVQNLISEIEDEKKLKNKINSMESEIEHNKSILIENFIFDLLHGNIESRNEFHSRMDFLNIEFSKTYYTCLLFSIPKYHEITKDQGIKKLQSYLYSIREISGKIMCDYEIWSLIGEHGNLTFMIGNDALDEAHYFRCFTKVLEQVVEDITRLLNISVIVTVGGIYKNSLEISKSFREAEIALENNAISDKTSIVNINDIPTNDGSRYIYPIDKEKILLRSLADTNESNACNVIRDLFDEMESQRYTKNRMRIDIMGLLGMVSRKAMDMGVDMYKLYSHNLLDPYTAFERYQTRDQMENWLRNIIVKAIHEIKNQQVFNVKSIIEQANEYLEGNYAKLNLSLISISEHVHLSPSYFSRLYKKETGESYVEALTRIRLEKAKTLLKETNERIAAISESVGYSDPKYFCTIFRKYQGLTPVEFREA